MAKKKIANGSAAGAIENGQLVPMTKDRLRMARGVLDEYKKAKTNLEARLIENDKWFKLKQWEVIKEKGAKTNLNDIQPKSGWLFNVLMGKQADMVEAYPEPTMLPREGNDQEEASRLTSILPVLLEQNDFKSTYSRNAWAKNTQGGCIYGVMYDSEKLNGLGDISVTSVDPLAMYWQPGMEKIQDSRNVFYVSLTDHDVLQEQYPDLDIPNANDTSNLVAKYKMEDEVDTSDKILVIDWYYKKRVDGRLTLQFCQFVGEVVLFATENDPEMGTRGLYDDGEYPFEFDILFPIPGSMWGIGLVDIAKSPQEVIDLLGQQIVKNAIMGATPRYFVRADGMINETEFSDYTKPIVHVTGEITPGMLQPIDVPIFSGSYLAVLQQKIDEMKFTTGNMDVQNGGTSGTSTASGMIAQMEVAGRSSKSAIDATYLAFQGIVLKVIERIRQFYDMPRQFRILGERGKYEFIEYQNTNIQAQTIGEDMFRKPLFDVAVKAARQTSYSRLAQNEMILDFFTRGFFSPDLAEQAMMAVEMMDFPGKDELIQKIQKQATLVQMLQQYMEMALALTAKHEPQMYQQLAMQAQQTQMSGVMGNAQLPAMQDTMQGEDAQKRYGMSSGMKGAATRLDRVKDHTANITQPG